MFPEEGPLALSLWKGDRAPGKGRTSLFLTPRGVELRPCPLEEAQRACAAGLRPHGTAEGQ